MENFEQIHVSRTDQPEVTENQMEVDHLEICVNNQPSELPRDEDGTDDSNQPSDDEDEYKDQNELENITSTQQKEDLVSDHPHEVTNMATLDCLYIFFLISFYFGYMYNSLGMGLFLPPFFLVFMYLDPLVFICNFGW